MSAILAQTVEPAKSRVRLIALSYANYNNTIPMPGSRIRGESGLAEPPTVTGRTSTRRRDELLLRLERTPEDLEPMTGRKDDSNVVAIDRHHRTMTSPFWATLRDGLQQLQALDGFGWRLVVETLVEPDDARNAFARIHALKYVAGGQYGSPVATPRAGLVRALMLLDRELLPSGLTFPGFVHAQVESWDAWIAAIAPRKTQSGKIVRASTSDGRDIDENAYAMRAQYVRELDLAGLTQAQIATDLGITQQMVSKILKARDSEVSNVVWIDRREGRVYRDVTHRFDHPTVTS